MTLRALCVGIDAYSNPADNLAGCVNDARAWDKVLSDRGAETKRLENALATRRGIIDGLRSLVGELAPGDLGVFVYSGHGSYVADALPGQTGSDEPDGRDEVLCPHDVNTAGPIVDDELHRIINERASGARLLMIADSCHSGTVSKMMAGALLRPERKTRFLPPQRFAGATPPPVLPPDQQPERVGALLLAGCHDFELSYEDEIGGAIRGAFSYWAIRSLSANPSSYRAWYSMIRKSLPADGFLQTPQLFGTPQQKSWPIFR